MFYFFSGSYLSYILIIALFVNPINLYIKDNTRKGHRPSVEYYQIKNSYLSISHLFAIILPKKFLSNYSGLEQPVVPTPNIILNNPDINVVVIMGESANRNFMSLYGYHIKSTPYLESLKNDKNFIYMSWQCLMDAVKALILLDFLGINQ